MLRVGTALKKKGTQGEVSQVCSPPSAVRPSVHVSHDDDCRSSPSSGQASRTRLCRLPQELRDALVSCELDDAGVLPLS